MGGSRIAVCPQTPQKTKIIAIEDNFQENVSLTVRKTRRFVNGIVLTTLGFLPYLPSILTPPPEKTLPSGTLLCPSLLFSFFPGRVCFPLRGRLSKRNCSYHLGLPSVPSRNLRGPDVGKNPPIRDPALSAFLSLSGKNLLSMGGRKKAGWKCILTLKILLQKPGNLIFPYAQNSRGSPHSENPNAQEFALKSTPLDRARGR